VKMFRVIITSAEVPVRRSDWSQNRVELSIKNYKCEMGPALIITIDAIQFINSSRPRRATIRNCFNCRCL
jgi:hypothetical protein